MSLFAKNGIPIHFFNYHCFYSRSYYPCETLLSGELIVRQTEFYLNNAAIELDKLFVEGATKNILNVLSLKSILGVKKHNPFVIGGNM